jgi:hypothetical protein
MADHPNVEGARTSLEALMKGDIETMAAGIADEAVWHIPGTNRWAGDFSGKPAIMGRLQQMIEAGIQTQIDEIHDIVGNEDHVVALVKVTLIAPSGSVSQRSAWIMHARDGKATEFWAHNADQAGIDTLLGA